jgi:diaminopropionate ammonia-lyase
MRNSELIVDHVARDMRSGAYPESLNDVLSPAMVKAAYGEISNWPAYEATPLRSLDTLAASLSLGAIYYKDESTRLGLGSFKALGGAYAVLRLAATQIEAKTGKKVSLADVRAGIHAQALSDLTVVTATDGNHGRSVAWGAQMAGCACQIYIHAGVSEGRKKAMEAFGATVSRIPGDYDESLKVCAKDAKANDWFIVSDTSYPGYMTLPRHVMAGYSVMATEVLAQLADTRPTHVFLQAGVGGLAAAICATLWQKLGDQKPRTIIVEPTRAACVLESARQDKPMAVEITEETIMAGLSCGEVSLLAWDVLSQGASDFITIGEDGIGPAMRLLASGKAGGGSITAGESAVPGLLGAIGSASRADLRDHLGLGPDSTVLVFGCEGATDPVIYDKILQDAGPDDDDLIRGVAS